MSDETDEDCIRMCWDGRPEAFRHLVGRYEGPLRAFLVARLDDRDEASEAVQETFVRAYFALPRLKRPEVFWSWLLGIADRVAMESRRRRRRAPRQGETAFLDGVEARAESGGHSDGALARIVAELPGPQREVIFLRFYGGRSCDEIARRQGVPVGTITSRLSRAYATIREALRREERVAEAGH
jgi:RNA polymerase sigma-70 factor (ECF subfamily)